MIARALELSDMALELVAGGRLKPDWDRSKPGAPSNHETELEAAERELKRLMTIQVR